MGDGLVGMKKFYFTIEDVLMLTDHCLCFSHPHPFHLASDPESFRSERDTDRPVVQDVRPTYPEAD